MSQAVRIQRKRTKGWKMPPNTIYVGRPSLWGNPWSTKSSSAEEAVDLFRHWFEVATIDSTAADGRRGSKKALAILTLKGKNLACWCPIGSPCHADVLLEIANAPTK